MKGKRMLSALLALILLGVSLFVFPITARAEATTEEALALYKNAVQKTINDYPSATKKISTTLSPWRGSGLIASLLNLQIAGVSIEEAVSSFLGEGTEYFFQRTSLVLLNPTLTAADVKSQSVTVAEGITTLVIDIVDEVNPQYGSSAIGRFTSDFPTEQGCPRGAQGSGGRSTAFDFHRQHGSGHKQCPNHRAA